MVVSLDPAGDALRGPLRRVQPGVATLVGGKNAALAEMTLAGFPVPPGFAVTTEAFATLWDDHSRAAELHALLAGADPTDAAGLGAVSQAVRERVEATPLDPAVADEVGDAYERLGRRCGSAEVPVAVRSSASLEDCSESSFAGGHDTYLAVQGADAVLRHLVRCWSSLWTARVMHYRAATGCHDVPPAMSVGVQKMIRPKAAGVALTINPTNGDRSQVAIDASWGLGHAVAAGEVTPDHYLVDKVVFQISHRRLSHKEIEYRVGGDGLERAVLPSERSDAPCLTDAEVVSVARLARAVERFYGSAQDIEWALDADAEPPGDLVLLQARPETVWSQTPRPPVAKAGDGLAGIVSTL